MSSKRFRFAQPTPAQANISAIVDPAREQAKGADLVPVAKIRPDDKNARQIPLSWEDPSNIDPDDPDRERKEAYLESVRGLARSIEKVGLINPVQVYRKDGEFRLITGHRRLLAHILLGRESIYATLDKTPLVRLSQFVENFQREDIGLYERLIVAKQMLEEAGVMEASTQAPLVAKLKEHAGLSQTAAYRWAAIIRAPAEVTEAVLDGRITSEKAAAKIAAMPADEIPAAIEALSGNEQSSEDDSAAPPPGNSPGHRPAPSGRGRPTSNVTLKTDNTRIIRYMMERILGDEGLPDIDWQDLKAVNVALKDMVKNLEKKLA